MNLTCEQTTELLDGYLNRELDEREVEDVECHLTSCAECRAFLEWITDALVDNERIPEEHGRGARTKSIMEQVRIVATERDASRQSGRGSDLPRPGWRRVPARALVAVAAGFLLVTSILFLLQERPAEPLHERALALLWRSDGVECLEALNMLEADRGDLHAANEMLSALDPTMEPACLAMALRIASSVGWDNLQVPRWIADWRERLAEDAAESSIAPGDPKAVQIPATSGGFEGHSRNLLDVLAADSFGIALREYTDEQLGALLSERRRLLMRLAWRLEPDAARPHLLQMLKQPDISDADRIVAANLLGADPVATIDERREILQGFNDALEQELSRDPKSALVGVYLRAAGSIIRSGALMSDRERSRFREIAMNVVSESPRTSAEDLAHALSAVGPLLSEEEAVTTFFSMLDEAETDHRVARDAIRLLGEHWSARVASRVDTALASLLRHRHEDVRYAVLGLIGRNHLSESEEKGVATALAATLAEVIEIARGTRSASTEWRLALTALADLVSEPTAERALFDLMRDSEGDALRALLNEVESNPRAFGSREWTASVLAIALDESKYGDRDRTAALEALGSLWLTPEALFGESSLTDALFALCDTGSPTIRRTAIRTLGKMVETSDDMRRELPSSEEVIAKANMLLQDENYGVRVAAFEELEKLGGESIGLRRVALTWLDEAATLAADDQVLERLVDIAAKLVSDEPSPVVFAALERLVAARPDSRAGRAALLALARARAGTSDELIASLPTDTWRGKTIVTLLRALAGEAGMTQSLSRHLGEAPEAFLRAANAEWSSVRGIRQDILTLRKGQPVEDTELIALLEVALLDPVLWSKQTGAEESDVSAKDVWSDYTSLQGELTRRVREYLDAPEATTRIRGGRLLQWMEGPGATDLLERAVREADVHVSTVNAGSPLVGSRDHWVSQILNPRSVD